MGSIRPDELWSIDALVNALAVVVWEFEWSTGAFTYVSDACEAFLGYSREEWMVPGFWSERVHPDDIEYAAGYCERATSDGLDHVFEYRMVRRDGSVIWVRDVVTVDPVKRLNGHLRGVFVDISDSKRQEELLARTEARFRATFERSPFGMHIYELVDDHLVFVEGNSASESILKIFSADLAGTRMEEAFPGSRDWQPRLISMAREGGAWQFEVEYDDGRVSGVFDNTAFFTVPGQIVLKFADITRRKEIERSVAEYNRRLSAMAASIQLAEDLQRRRLATELHDRVSQPLAVAGMRLRAVARGDSPCDLDGLIELLEQAIAETRAITSDLYPPALAELGLGSALRWLAEDLDRLYGLRCHVFVDGPVEASEEISLALFRSARELLTNVVKHAGTNEAWLSLDGFADKLVLTVSDEGGGFAPAWGGRRPPDAGFGLFSITERIEYLGGSCDIESSSSGTWVTITLPSEGGPAPLAPLEGRQPGLPA